MYKYIQWKIGASDLLEGEVSSEKHWHVLYIKPRKEDVVKTLLGRIGIETFYPKVRVKVKGKEKVEPMFPLYMFARFSVPEDFINVKFCRGVRTIIHFGSNVPYLPDDFIDYLKSISGQLLIEPKTPFKVGSLVRIVEGPFRGLVGEIIKTDDKNKRVVLLLKAASLCPTITVPSKYLSPAS